MPLSSALFFSRGCGSCWTIPVRRCPILCAIFLPGLKIIRRQKESLKALCSGPAFSGHFRIDTRAVFRIPTQESFPSMPEFPALTRNDVNPAIRSARYELDLDLVSVPDIGVGQNARSTWSANVMELLYFLKQTQSEVRSEIGDRLGEQGNGYPYPESIFSEVVMQHMSEIGMTFEPVQVCHYAAKVGNANLRLSGYAISEEADQLDLFVSLYDGVDDLTPIPDSQTKTAAEQCLRFLSKCAQRRLAATMDQSNDAYALAWTIQECYAKLNQIRVYVLTDRQAKAKNFKPREVSGKTVKLEVMDIQRLHRHWSEGKPRDELVVNFNEVADGALPCVYVPGDMEEYDYALTVIPGEAMRFLYEKYGARLLEANVRSFLSMTGKVNRGIRDTLKDDPERFMAYNNGIVIVADEISLGKTSGWRTGHPLAERTADRKRRADDRRHLLRQEKKS